MSTLIVGLDFSKGSVYALRLAIDVANRCEYDVKIVWVENKRDSDKNIRKKLEDTINEYQSILKKTKLSCVIREGRVNTEIVAQAKEDKADLIVLGAHGDSGYAEKEIGSNAFKIAIEAPCSTLLIRENFNFDKKLEKILLPLDSSEATRQKVPFAANMAKIFDSEICILGLYTSKMDDVRKIVNRFVTQTKEFLKKEGVPYTSECKDAENLTKTALSYAESICADLIIIMTEQEKTFSNLFTGSYASQMLHTSSIPILSVPPQEINSASR